VPVVIVEAVAPLASWRPPEALTYHRTFPLPPYTTLVGVLGAAMGLDLQSAYRFAAAHELQLGVGGRHEGEARDLWKFQKLKDQTIERDILLRELLIDMRMALVVACRESDVAESIAAAFQHPAYPLTAGTSDSLLQPVRVSVAQAEREETFQPLFALVFGEISPTYVPYAKLQDIPLMRSVRAPSVERIPTGFAFDDAGNRSLAGRSLVTFVSDPIRIDPGAKPVVGYRVDPQSSFLRRTLHDWQELPWIIPVHRYD
jgi:CRISPR-associated protein Cas5t